MGIAALIAQLTHVDPAPQAESQRLASMLGQIDLGLKRKGFETTPQLDHQATGAEFNTKVPST